jgi:hypothetical protein
MEHHNSWWPHRPRFEAGRRAELANGNVLLVTEKDYEQTDCSVHWFDYHQSGIVAGAYYNGGVRLIDARDPRDLKSFGFAFGAASETWDSY